MVETDPILAITQAKLKAKRTDTVTLLNQGIILKGPAKRTKLSGLFLFRKMNTLQQVSFLSKYTYLPTSQSF
jgi:hypothetical protein